MEVRIIEWQRRDDHGFTQVSTQQGSAGYFGVQEAPLKTPIETSQQLRRRLPEGINFGHDSRDSLRLVFGGVDPADSRQIADWLVVIFPDLEDPGVAGRVLSDPTDDEHVLVRFSRRTLAVNRVRVSVPRLLEDGTLRWYGGMVAVLENAIFVLWESGPDEDISPCARVDGRARNEQYLAREEMSVVSLADNYLSEVAHLLASVAQESTRLVDRWEAELFAVGTDPVEPDLAMIANLRRSASRLQNELDGLRREVRPGLWRAVWSTGTLERIGTRVDAAITSAEESIGRLRDDVSGAFLAAGTIAISAQLKSSREQEAKAARLQRIVTRLTSFLLVPGLIVGIFGANVALPGSGSERAWAMVVLMVVGALLTYWLLGRLADGEGS
jgi:CorA-like Mg2+ transporter protein